MNSQSEQAVYQAGGAGTRRRVTKWQRGENRQRMQQGVKMVRVGGHSIATVATRLGLPERTLRRC